ncbi:MAG: hypothetical protein KatS3mg061_2283 [Dehalococcoidia bacterium]|nr:MAG: hypothetical protein KatS3mg061_2283 [Dehalococcoidia bacterium]
MRCTRREVLQGALALGAVGVLGGCARLPEVRVGIAFGTQPLWRYAAARKAALEQATGTRLSFLAYASEGELRRAFRSGQLEVIATQPTQLPLLRGEVGPLQFFLALAWVAESLPLIVAADAPFSRLDDLTGKRLAILGSDDPGLAYWRAFVLALTGTRLEDRLHLVSGIENPGLAILNGTVEAAVVNSGLWVSYKASGRFRAVMDLGQAWNEVSRGQPPLVFGGYVARQEWLAANRPVVEALARLTREGFERFVADPAEFGRVVAEFQQPASGAPGVVAVAAQQPEQALAIARFLGMDVVTAQRLHLAEGDIAAYRLVFELLARAGYLPAPVGESSALFLSGVLGARG